MLKKAMILAAGFGKRIHPLTLKTPKPLLKIGQETLLSNTLKFIKSLGIEHVVINVHYLAEEIINYLDHNKFDLSIKIIEEKEKILDTGGGVLNAIQNFSTEPFLIINPDTIWSKNYIIEIKNMEKIFLNFKKSKCLLLVVNKSRSFDKSFQGDFDLKDNSISRSEQKNLDYIYTGAQIIKPEIFKEISDKIFSINKIWNQLIEKNELIGFESKIDFLHVSNLSIYKSLLESRFKH